MTDRPSHRGNQSKAQISKAEQGDALVATFESVSLDSNFPPVAWLLECDQHNPGFMKRYLDDFLDERTKIADAELAHVTHVHKTQRLGQVFGLTIGLFGISAAFLISYLAKDPVTASVVGGGTVLGLVATFVTGRWIRPTSEQKGIPELSTTSGDSKPSQRSIGKQ